MIDYNFTYFGNSMSYAIQKKEGIELNRFYENDQSIHDWYRFVLSFPPHLVRNYIEKFNLNTDSCILDPFSGTGTTLVEAKKLRIQSIGVEANPVAHLAAQTKVNWHVNTQRLLYYARCIATTAREKLIAYGDSYLTLNQEEEKLLIKNSISPLPLHKALVLLGAITQNYHSDYDDLFKVAFAKQVVFRASNLHFGPEVGVSRKKRFDADIINLWMEQVERMASDIESYSNNSSVYSYVYSADSREISKILQPDSIDAVITSPPYPNEKDYTRTTRLESVLLGFIRSRDDLRKFKQRLLRSNTRNVYKGDDDDNWVTHNKNIDNIAINIEKRRVELGKTSGFEKLYHKVVRLYFGGMARHLEEMKPILKNGAKLAYVVGDQASYFRTPIRTGYLLADIATDLGYTVIDIELFRTRISTVTKEKLREEVLILKWNN
ncbi:MAG: DNA methyltransferase [Pseudomonadota bacterium]|nr:DNA methyltransferase [Pseudomonadota bacterium]